MSSFPIFTEPVQPVIFPVEPGPALLQRLSAVPKLTEVRPASRLEVRPRPEMASTAIAEIDALAGGLPRGCLSEICGASSSGTTSVMLAALSAATRREEVCALVDTSNAFSPLSASAAGMALQKLLWVRCQDKTSSPQRHRDTEKTIHRIDEQKHGGTYRENEHRVEQALRALDLLLQSGGFGLVAVDFSDVPFQLVRRIPLASWFRFQRVVENTPTVLLIIAPVACAQTCASLVVKLSAKLSAVSSQISAKTSGRVPTHAELFNGLQIEAELLRSRLERKPVQPVRFATRVARAG
jgi:hypothetical protein